MKNTNQRMIHCSGAFQDIGSALLKTFALRTLGNAMAIMIVLTRVMKLTLSVVSCQHLSNILQILTWISIFIFKSLY